METHKKSVLHDKNAVRFLRYLSCFSALPIFSATRANSGMPRVSPRTVSGSPAAVMQSMICALVRLPKPEEQAVDQCFSPLGKAGVYHLEEQLFVGDGAGGRSPAPEGNHRRG